MYKLPVCSSVTVQSNVHVKVKLTFDLLDIKQPVIL